MPNTQTPEGAQQLAATISRQVSYFSLQYSRAGSSNSLDAMAAAASDRAHEAVPLMGSSPFDQHVGAAAGEGEGKQAAAGAAVAAGALPDLPAGAAVDEDEDEAAGAQPHTSG